MTFFYTKPYQFLLTLFLISLTSGSYAQKAPYFKEGESPVSSEKKWKLVKSMSDEFSGSKVNQKKWQISGQGWIGRAPGLFLPSNVTVAHGNLQITATKLPKDVKKEGKVFTHGGGYAGSRKGMTYGYYECRMKGNKTFMSSTFWLINEREEAIDCDRRVTELDVQECVGQINTDKDFAQDADQRMGFNTHSRGIQDGCDIPAGTIGGKTPTAGKTYEDFHVYGVWWKSEKEVLFFLDGEFVEKVTPKADFNLPMHLRMVVETYNWNPVPEDGGMTGSFEDRTTLYDWVRTWKLVD
ncbi:family 16 glycosylhydrolase [Tamlana fucoidanivorans]|uniref:Glycosyl hydrolase family protein n=1 Tax=Allotamlana fucoidanivorans TaxID=2583814 RepID=A0A5C4SI70_9FLAO|nr:family 16 glycosylhydrolase [Tamlana fucoidanivorans]TNJ43433.1 glycosyl hydrolase family protein [Tamlana fucoidanivorans]